MAKQSKKSVPPVEPVATPKQIEIVNAGPIHRLTIPVPEAGVVVLRGDNGSGKSTAIATAEAIIAGENASDITVRDGTLNGHAEGLGVRINFARSRNTRTGELNAVRVEHHIDLAGFIDPGLSSPDAADRARVKSLANLAGVRADLALFASLHTGPNAIMTRKEFDAFFNPADFTRSDLVEMAATIKRRLHALARQHEDAAREHTGETAAHRSQAADIPEGVTTPPEMDELHGAVTQALREQDAVKRQADDARKFAERSAKASQAVAAMGDAAGLDELESEHVRLTAESANADAAFSAATLRRDRANEAVKESATRLNAARESARERARLLAVIAADQPAAPSADDLAAAARKVADARQAVEDGVKLTKALTARERANLSEAMADSRAASADTHRRAADSVEGIVTRAIHADGLQIIDGRLVTQTERGQTYFADLSHGERTRVALTLGLARVGRGGLLVLPQEFWEGLDGRARVAVDAMAREIGVVVLTAEASDDTEGEPIHAELFAADGRKGLENLR